MNYQTLQRIFEEQDADLGASEAHGIATAMLCVAEQADSRRWLDELFADSNQPDAEQQHALLKLFDETRQALYDDTDFSFDLLLPDDEPIADCAEALRCWCQGFLFGILGRW